MVDLLPQGLRDALGENALFWLAYLTNGKHLAWYASVQQTLAAALIGALVAMVLGLLTALMLRGGPWPARVLAHGYVGLIRGVPDVLFFLFFPLAFEQGVEWVASFSACSPQSIAAMATAWPPCDAANWHLSPAEYLILAGLSLGIIYGAFAGSVIAGALDAVPQGQLEAARALGMSRAQILFRIHIRQMWLYALPGLANCWMSLIKATSLLSLLQILDIVALAQRLGAANFSSAAGVIHGDWRWQYYAVLLLFYLALTFVSEKIFTALTRSASRGMIALGVHPV